MFDDQISSDDTPRGYGYQYDKLNRITYARYAKYTRGAWDSGNRYTVSNISYDLNGNIKTMKQRGVTHKAMNFNIE